LGAGAAQADGRGQSVIARGLAASRSGFGRSNGVSNDYEQVSTNCAWRRFAAIQFGKPRGALACAGKLQLLPPRGLPELVWFSHGKHQMNDYCIS
jgi:hypothetical protein